MAKHQHLKRYMEDAGCPLNDTQLLIIRNWLFDQNQLTPSDLAYEIENEIKERLFAVYVGGALKDTNLEKRG